MRKYNKENDQKIKDAIETSLTMAQACAKVGMNFSTFKRHAEHKQKHIGLEIVRKPL